MKKFSKLYDILCFVVGPILITFCIFGFRHRFSGLSGSTGQIYYPNETKLGLAIGIALICIGFLRVYWGRKKMHYKVETANAIDDQSRGQTEGRHINLIVGMDRIAILLAVIAIVPSFLIGVTTTNDIFKSETPEYKAFKLKPIPQNKNLVDHYLDAPPKYKNPLKYKSIIGGIIFSFVIFFIVLFSTRLITRGIKLLCLFIIDGFKT